MKRIRRAAVAGTFYPAGREELEDSVRALLDAAPRTAPEGSVVGIVAPHAGYIYSGMTAARAYAQVAGESRPTVVVVAPSHREFFDGVSVYPGDAYETPLGTVPVDVHARERLRAALPGLMVSTSGHGSEHALEVQLPFLQIALGPFQLLPLVIGHQSREHCFALGAALAEVFRETAVLLVASTDLSHFYPAAAAERLDAVVIHDLESMDAGRLMDDLASGTAEACGGGPVAAVMTACQRLGARHVHILGHTHSGAVSGDTNSVVGYLSAVMQN